MQDTEVTDHDRLIALEVQVRDGFKSLSDSFLEQKTLMTNHLAHHEALERIQKEKIESQEKEILEKHEKQSEKRLDRYFSLILVSFQVLSTAVLSAILYLIHLKH